MSTVIAGNARLVAELKEEDIIVLTPEEFARVSDEDLKPSSLDKESMGYDTDEKINDGSFSAFKIDNQFYIFIDDKERASGANHLDFFDDTVEGIKEFISQWT